MQLAAMQTVIHVTMETCIQQAYSDCCNAKTAKTLGKRLQPTSLSHLADCMGLVESAV